MYFFSITWEYLFASCRVRFDIKSCFGSSVLFWLIASNLYKLKRPFHGPKSSSRISDKIYLFFVWHTQSPPKVFPPANRVLFIQKFQMRVSNYLADSFGRPDLIASLYAAVIDNYLIRNKSCLSSRNRSMYQVQCSIIATDFLSLSEANFLIFCLMCHRHKNSPLVQYRYYYSDLIVKKRPARLAKLSYHLRRDTVL